MTNSTWTSIHRKHAGSHTSRHRGTTGIRHAQSISRPSNASEATTEVSRGHTIRHRVFRIGLLAYRLIHKQRRELWRRRWRWRWRWRWHYRRINRHSHCRNALSIAIGRQGSISKCVYTRETVLRRVGDSIVRINHHGAITAIGHCNKIRAYLKYIVGLDVDNDGHGLLGSADIVNSFHRHKIGICETRREISSNTSGYTLKFIGRFNNSTHSHPRMALPLEATGRLESTGTSSSGIKQITQVFPRFQGRQYGLNSLIFDCAFIGTDSSLRNEIPSNGHFWNIRHQQHATVCQGQVYPAAIGGNDCLTFQQRIANLQDP